MSSSPDNFVKSTEEGVARIRKGNYAYLVTRRGLKSDIKLFSISCVNEEKAKENKKI